MEEVTQLSERYGSMLNTRLFEVRKSDEAGVGHRERARRSEKYRFEDGEERT